MVSKTHEIIAVNYQQERLFNCLCLSVVKYRLNLDLFIEENSPNHRFPENFR
ncbi:MAG: hypothetical protein AAFO76_10300 [Cyanobacteria bacterium J06607_15]